MARPPDVVVTPTSPPGPAVGFALMGDGKTSDYSSGGYAWTAVPRSRRAPYLEFTSQLLVQLELPLMLDGSDTDTSIEAELAAVRSWRRQSPQTGMASIVTVTGPVDTVGIAGWAVETLQLDAAIRRPDGARTQQLLTLTLLEYPLAATPAVTSPAKTAAATLPFPFTLLPPALQALASQYTPQLAALAAQFAPQLTAVQTFVAGHGTDLTQLAQAVPQLQTEVINELSVLAATLPTVLAGLPPTTTSHRTCVVRPGDSLESVACRELGDYRRWTVIALLNNRRSDTEVAWGETLRLP